MLDSLALEIDFPIFNRISSFYNLLKDSLTIQNDQHPNPKLNSNYSLFRASLITKIPITSHHKLKPRPMSRPNT